MDTHMLKNNKFQAIPHTIYRKLTDTNAISKTWERKT